MSLRKIKKSALRELPGSVISAMKTDQLIKLVGRYARLVNPMYNKLYRAGADNKRLATDAYNYLDESGGLITTTSRNPDRIRMTRNELVHEATRAKHFLNMETSSVTGAREVLKQRADIVSESVNLDDMSVEERDKFVGEAWDQYHKWQETNLNIKYEAQFDTYMKQEMTPEREEAIRLKVRESIKQSEVDTLEEARKKTGHKPKYKFFN